MGLEGVVEEVDVASPLQWPHVFLEGLPLVTTLSLRQQKLRLWVHLLVLPLRHCCCCCSSQMLRRLLPSFLSFFLLPVLTERGGALGFVDSNFENLLKLAVATLDNKINNNNSTILGCSDY